MGSRWVGAFEDEIPMMQAWRFRDLEMARDGWVCSTAVRIESKGVYWMWLEARKGAGLFISCRVYLRNAWKDRDEEFMELSCIIGSIRPHSNRNCRTFT